VGAYRAATAEQAQLHDDLVRAGHLVVTDAAGIYGQGRDFVDVRTGFTDAVSRLAAGDAGVEAMAYPPLLPRYQIEKNGYLASFPHLAGSVFYPNVVVAGLFLALTGAACWIYGGRRLASKESSLR